MGIMMTLLSAAGSPYLRLRPTSRGAWAVETAVVSCALRDRASGSRLTVDLFSTVHLASGEYYAGIKAAALPLSPREQLEAPSNPFATLRRQDACTARYERVLFEMIADGSCFERGADGARRLVRPLQASDQQRVLAAQYGLTAQMDALDLCGDPFVHSDMLSAELGEAASSLATGGPLLDRAAEALGGLAPELLLLLDDWIASGGASPAPALRPIARAALRGDFAAARWPLNAASISEWRTAWLIGSTTSAEAAVGGALLYFLRHAAVYATLSAYAFDWDRRWYVEQGSGGGGSQQEGGALDAPADALIRADSALLRAGREPEGPAGQGRDMGTHLNLS
ncbi:hypothetical protein EMIHUDRAFT_206614 [Emiliania huxleyi CCMP1516]|uniref:Uncharacterized protein n=2 Tax=Emiliania huxleyi TaxID=2903 RepID=A0A0D3JM61_EMIH1|nr:hypothetical protein EMIHUDRAFT_206614 [Emiliania huxleyi CCMP1516]EOD24596.1 hypothetical protein EMIHUDRAFT_206614 [Emiliania huxleyi CCMP1516]|eukprot:XP_005777025.1 hypothetical protein EMIHUDRAFT_206614 [Emiliania huxleyi CCMP1516]